jgi:predicted Rossmann-fold nucleotide-binding protein
LGNARNNVNVLSSDVVIACGMGIGTASEVALALKNGKKVILLTRDPDSQKFFSNLSPNNILLADSPKTAIALAQQIIENNLDFRF